MFLNFYQILSNVTDLLKRHHPASKLEARSSKLEAGSSKLEARSSKLEARSSKLKLEASRLAKVENTVLANDHVNLISGLRS